MIDAAITITQTIDSRIELIVRPNGHHKLWARTKIVAVNRGDDELRLPFTIVELALIPSLVWQVEDIVLDPLIEHLEARDDSLDMVSNVIVVSDKCVPLNLR